MIQPPSPLPFDDIRALVHELPEVDDKAASRFAAQSGPAADRATETGRWMAGWQANGKPTVRRPVVALFAASHSVTTVLDQEMQVSQVAQLVADVQARSGRVARACERAELGLKVFELALELPVEDFSKTATMQETDCAATIAYGMEATADGCDLLVVRGMAAGGQTSTTAMTAALLGKETSINEFRNPAEIEFVDRALATHKSHLQSPLELLRRLGGRESAAVAGAIVAARLQRVPVILDGSQAVCVALVLQGLRPGMAEHCMVSCHDLHLDSARLCKALGRPLLLSGRYSEHDGTSGALAASLVKDILAVVTED